MILVFDFCSYIDIEPHVQEALNVFLFKNACVNVIVQPTILQPFATFSYQATAESVSAPSYIL